MAMNKVILIDADVISHFIGTGHIDDLCKILAPHQLYIVDNVYKEATYHPADADRKRKVDEWLERSKSMVRQISFPSRDSIRMEFFRLKHENRLLGDGECACMAMARYGQETIASSNFRDVAPYCTTNHIDYIGVLDILQIAINKKYWTMEQCNKFLEDAVLVNNARFPTCQMENYQPTIDLGSF